METAVLVAIIMAVASIAVAIINKLDTISLRRDMRVIKHQTNAMQDEMQRLAKAEGKAEQRAENAKG